MLSLIAAGMLLAGSDPPRDVAKVIVDGNGSISTPPDIATLSYSVRGEGQTSDAAAAALVARGAMIEKALRSIDPALEMHDSSLKIVPVRGVGCKDGNDDDNGNTQVHLSTGPCAIVGYRASTEASVKTLDVADAGTLVGLASRQGGLDASIDRFAIRNVRGPQQQALAAAFADALAKAQALAAAGHFRVGRILSASTVGDRGEDIFVTARKAGGLAEVAAPPPITISLKPAPVVSAAQVEVTYAIEP